MYFLHNWFFITIDSRIPIANHDLCLSLLYFQDKVMMGALLSIILRNLF